MHMLLFHDSFVKPGVSLDECNLMYPSVRLPQYLWHPSGVNEIKINNKTIWNKRHRGLDVMLGHVLEKVYLQGIINLAVHRPWIFKRKLDTWKLEMHSDSYCMRLTSEAEILAPFAVRPLFFKIKGARKLEMLEHLTVRQNTLYTLHAYRRSPNFGPFCFTTIRFRDTMSSKVGNAPNDPKLNLNT